MVEEAAVGSGDRGRDHVVCGGDRRDLLASCADLGSVSYRSIHITYDRREPAAVK